MMPQRIDLQPHGNAIKAQEMARYMKNRFPFLGINKPERHALIKPLLKHSQSWTPRQLSAEVLYYYGLPEREYQYLAIDLVQANVKRVTLADWERCYFDLLDQKAWWDSVDSLRKPLADLLLQNPDQLAHVVQLLMNDASLWKRRVAITVQLQYKEKTNKELLQQSIEASLTINEFFIQKAIGWALRDYSKHNPQWVRQFMAEHSLSALAAREGSKYL
ncbi:DNA alkylation repair protein [Saezia sanguinis]|nr:DNA alkylation repair protein [Saezia sanguinis]